uniref:Uncharacterized protein n=1 Tax=Plectus sambesii TaxID=2011161 RepID=A0A914WYF9_9BILA
MKLFVAGIAICLVLVLFVEDSAQASSKTWMLGAYGKRGSKYNWKSASLGKRGKTFSDVMRKVGNPLGKRTEGDFDDGWQVGDPVFDGNYSEQ